MKSQQFYFAAMLIWLALPAAALAATAQDARHFVDEVGSKVLGVVNSGGGNGTEKKQQLQQMFAEHVDIPWMGRFVLGRYWQQATPDQRNHYLKAYRQYLLARYTTNFADYSGSKYEITDVKDNGNGEFTVKMNINSPQQSEATLAGYLLQADNNGQFKIHDIIIEGVSLITTQRSEFASVAQRNGIDGLIEAIQKKAQTEQQPS